MVYQAFDILPRSGLRHVSFCRCQRALIHAEQRGREALSTARGQPFRTRVHDASLPVHDCASALGTGPLSPGAAAGPARYRLLQAKLPDIMDQGRDSLHYCNLRKRYQ